jgi:hypothetical protein
MKILQLLPRMKVENVGWFRSYQLVELIQSVYGGKSRLNGLKVTVGVFFKACPVAP